MGTLILLMVIFGLCMLVRAVWRKISFNIVWVIGMGRGRKSSRR